MSYEPSELDPPLAENLRNWDSRVPIHLGPDGYEVERYVGDPARISAVVAFDAGRLGDLRGLSVVHLQCHVGTDTISLARLGASEVVGVDFSEPALGAARELAERTGDKARFVLSDVYHAAGTLEQRFDVLYTSVGTIGWLDDIDRWALNVAGLLVSGGRFVFRDIHPVIWVFEEVDGRIVPHFAYWQESDRPLVLEEAETYSGRGTVASPRINVWNHTVAEVLNALIGVGLRIDRVEEHPECDWRIFPSTVAEGEHYFLPDGLRDKLPVCWSITATKT
jgi:SAM-dependent methyltransferase